MPVETVRPHGGPHVATRWFVWQPDALYVATRVGDSTWEALEHDGRISLLIDRGREWNDLSGVRIEGVAELLPAEHPDLREPMSAWHEKYRDARRRRLRTVAAAIRSSGSSVSSPRRDPDRLNPAAAIGAGARRL